MKDIKIVLNESKTRPEEIQRYIESWLKQPEQQKEMFEIIGAIVQGAKDAYEYRTAPRFTQHNSDEYDKASKALKNFIDELK